MSQILARITLKPTNEGGRKTPLTEVYHCPVFFPNVPALAAHGYDCRLYIKGLAEELRPGEMLDNVPIAFLYDVDVRPYISVGTKFTIWEGGTVGEGEIIEM